MRIRDAIRQLVEINISWFGEYTLSYSLKTRFTVLLGSSWGHKASVKS